MGGNTSQKVGPNQLFTLLRSLRQKVYCGLRGDGMSTERMVCSTKMEQAVSFAMQLSTSLEKELAAKDLRMCVE